LLQAAGIRNISVSSSQGKFLHVLVQLCQASRILEIGTLAGYSTIWMARALPPGGVLISIENNKEHAAIARRNVDRAGLSRIVEVRVGDAQAVLKGLEQEDVAPFDVVFIDADKVSYDRYFRHALKLTRKGSLIVADNVIRQGRILQAGISDSNVLGARRFLQTLAKSKRVSAAIVQMVGAKGHDGMAIAVVK
jgi:caffeoyl-CoA O-methyltransferase